MTNERLNGFINRITEKSWLIVKKDLDVHANKDTRYKAQDTRL